MAVSSQPMCKGHLALQIKLYELGPRGFAGSLSCAFIVGFALRACQLQWLLRCLLQLRSRGSEAILAGFQAREVNR